MKCIVLFTAVGSLALAGTPARAQSPDDVRCLMISNVFAKAGKEEKIRKVAQAAMYFYLGRIDGRLNDVQLKAALGAQQKALKGLNVGPIMKTCAQNMETSVKRLQTLSRQSGPAK